MSVVRYPDLLERGDAIDKLLIRFDISMDKDKRAALNEARQAIKQLVANAIHDDRERTWAHFSTMDPANPMMGTPQDAVLNELDELYNGKDT